MTSVDPDRRYTRLGTPEGRDPDGSLTVRSAEGREVVLNPTAAALWELCDGSTTVDEMVEATTSLFSGSSDRIRQDVVETLYRLEDEQLLA